MKLILCVIVLLVAHASHDAASPRDEPRWNEVASNDGSWIVRWRLLVEGKPAELPLARKRFTIELQIESTGDPQETPTAVLVDAQMPEHLHGMNVAPIIALTTGAVGSALATAEGMLFHMSGRWEVDVDIDDGTTVERAQWNITLP